MTEPSRGRGKSEMEELLMLCRDDRRKLYGLLDADLPKRVSRVEKLGLALLVATASPKVGGPSVNEIISAAINFA